MTTDSDTPLGGSREAPSQNIGRLTTGQRLLAWATAAAILMGGLNAMVQMARVVLGH